MVGKKMKPHLEKSLKMFDKYMKDTSQDVIDKEIKLCESYGPTLGQ